MGGTSGSASTSAATSRWRTRSGARSSTPAWRTPSSSTAQRRTSSAIGPRSRAIRSSTPSATGVPADAIREMAHAYATADKAMICWTLGITEHHDAVDNVLALINLSLLTGHVGKWAAGSTRCAARTMSRAAATWAHSDRLPGSSTSRTTRSGSSATRCGSAWSREARLAPVRNARSDGSPRAHCALRDRREPDAVRGGSEADDSGSAASTSSSSRTSS